MSRNSGGRVGRKKQEAQGKISVRLLEFAEPMISEAFEGHGEPTVDDLESLLKVVAAIWNVKVMEQIGRGSGYVEEVERLIFRVLSAGVLIPSGRPSVTSRGPC